jgi:DnaK suppressor protein
MNTDHFRKLLLAKRRELQSRLAGLEQEASAPADAGVVDYTDTATNEQEASDSLEIATKLSETLEEVQNALRRIEDGTYGKCVVCGRQIEQARLEAIPWTPNCLEDQEKLDGTVTHGATL